MCETVSSPAIVVHIGLAVSFVPSEQKEGLSQALYSIQFELVSHPHTWHKSQACAGTSGARSRHLQVGAKPGRTDGREQVQLGNLKQSRCLTEASTKHRTNVCAVHRSLLQTHSVLINLILLYSARMVFKLDACCSGVPADVTSFLPAMARQAVESRVCHSHP